MIALDISLQRFLTFKAQGPGFCSRVALHEEIVSWLNENVSEWKFINHYTTEPSMEYWIRFDSEAELSAFKLCWWGVRP